MPFLEYLSGRGQAYLSDILIGRFHLLFTRSTSRSRGKLLYRLLQRALLVERVSEHELKAVIPMVEDEAFDGLEACIFNYKI